MRKFFLPVYLVLLLLASCSKHTEHLADGRVLSRFDVMSVLGPSAVLSQSCYYEVRYERVPEVFSEMKRYLFSKNIGISSETTGWDGKFNCVCFTAAFIQESELEFYAEEFQSNTPAGFPAIFDVWYTQDSGGGHSVAAMITNHGVIYYDAQIGEEVHLSEKEIKSIYHLQR